MAILVTGGTGFIGSHTVVELIKAGREVVIVDNFSNSKPEVLNRIEKITGVRPVSIRQTCWTSLLWTASLRSSRLRPSSTLPDSRQ